MKLSYVSGCTECVVAILMFFFSDYDGICADFRFRFYRVEDGLSSNTVFKIIQDKDGLMWFGTNDGLSRYDGTTVKTWRNVPEDTLSIGNNTVFALGEDETGTIYAGTENGLWAFDKRRENFRCLLPSVQVRCLDVDKFGFVWLSTLGQGIFRVKEGEVRHYDSADGCGLSSNYVPYILCDDRGDVWCVNADKWLFRYNRSDDIFTSFVIRDEHKDIVENKAFSLCTDFQGNIWIGGWGNGIFRYDIEKGEFTNFMTKNGRGIHSGRIHTISELQPGVMSYGCDHGLVSMNVDSGMWEILNYQPDRPGSISDNFVYDIVRDREGGLWVATYFGGVNYAHRNNCLFNFGMTDRSGVKGRIISKFCEDENRNIWIGTDDGGLFLYNRESGTCSEQVIDKEIPNLNIHALMTDGNGLWIGTYSNGLYYLDKKTRKVTHWKNFGYGDNSSDLPDSESIYAFYKDIKGRLWIGTQTGLSVMENGAFRRIADIGYNSDILEIKGDSDGNIWCASIKKGLLKYSSRTGTIESFNAVTTDGIVLPNETISLQIDKDVLWIGTSGKGLFCYNLKSGELKQVVCSNVLTSNHSIFHIIVCNEALWLTTNKGLVRYSYQAGTAHRYNTEDGLIAEVFNFNSGLLTTDGTVFIGTNGGFNYFRPEDIMHNATPPQVYVDYVSSGDCDGRLLAEKAELEGRLDLRTDNMPMSMRVAVSSFIAPHKNRVLLMVEGRDKDWVEAEISESGNVFIGKMPRGTYTIRVKGSNNDGVLGAEKGFIVRMHPHWYDCGLALVLYFIGVVISGYFLYKHWIDFQREKKANKEERIRRDREKVRLETELELFNNIARDIRTPVMLINGPANEILSEKGLSESVRQNAMIIKRSSDKLFVLTHEILNFLKQSMARIGTDCLSVEPMSRTEEESAEEIRNNINNLIGSHTLDEPGWKKEIREVTLMVVDDNEDVIDFLQKALQRHYRNVMVASNGIEAKTILYGNQRIDLIISDVGDGLELCECVRNEERFRHIPLILMSSNDELSLKMTGIEKGADIFLEKPLDIGYLIAQIDNIFDKRKVIWDSFSKRPYPAMRAIVQGKGDEMFLAQLSEIVQRRMSDVEFSVEDLAAAMNISRSVLFEKVKAICDMTPNNYIKEMRLRKAASLLAEQKYKVNEVCYMVGFNTPSYFAKCFLRHFGILPKDFISFDNL